jgi:hypothetical protein
MVDQKPPFQPARSLPPAIPSQVRARPQDPRAAMPPKKRANYSSLPFWFGVLMSVVWIAMVIVVIAQAGPARTFGGLSLADWAIGISAISAPVALIWMVSAYLQRGADIQSIAEPLRRQLMMITGESGAAEARIRRFNQAVREQLDLLKSAQHSSHEDITALLDRVRKNRGELERFEQNSAAHIQEIQTIVRQNMQHVEQLMEDKFTMMRVIDDRLIQSGEGVSRQMESVRGQLSHILDSVESNAQVLSSSLEHALQDSKKLADTSRMQEASLLTAAQSAADTLNGVSGKIDLSIARFLERAGAARGEAEHLASALDAQARSLDEFSNTLPARVSEAEAVLRGVADRLSSSEQVACEQAVSLGERLAQQVEGLEKFLNRFSERFTGFDGSLQKRRDDMDQLLSRVSSSTDSFVQRWENSITDINLRTESCMQRFAVVNEDSRKRAEEVSGLMAAAADRYESAGHRMHSLSNESATALKSIAADVSTQLAQFEALRAASQQAGQDVESRSAAALQNLQHMLERLLTARDATQTVGETLVKDLYSAVGQNEQLIGRLNETAQMSVRALGIAAESLGRQEGELAAQARAAESMLQEAIVQTQSKTATAEKILRDQAAALMSLLAETNDKLNATDQRLHSFTTQSIAPIQAVIQQVDASTAQGLQSMGRFGDGLQQQLDRLQQFSGRIGGLGDELGRAMSENISSIENLNGRLNSVRATQEETARQTIDQFGSMADRLQREIAGLGDQTGQAVATLQQAATRVGEQSNKLLHDAQSSGAQMQIVTTALQNEAGQIRSILQKQTDELSSDLSRAEKQFLTIGEALKQRTDSAYALLDRVAAHYNEVTRAAAQELEARSQRFEHTTAQAQTKADAFGAALSQQLGLITNGTAQLETQATQINALGNKTIQQLSAINDKFALTHEAANSNVQQAIARFDECNNAFARQSGALSDAAQNAVAQIQRAGAAFGEQSGKMLDNSQQTEQYIRNLGAATSALAEQSGQIRSSMEQQSQRLVAQLTEAIIQLEATDGKLRQTALAAAEGAGRATELLNDAAQHASTRLTSSHQEMQNLAERTENALSALGGNLTRQTASLTAMHDQIGEQFRAMSAASENQRTQLIDLFEKLGAAHSQASDVAERTIGHLTESLQQIHRQLGAMSDQSQSAVVNVRAAGASFGDQATALLQNAQQAEQQARTVLSVTSALQDQARQLREALHNEGERTNDLLGSLLGKITTGGAELRDLGTSAELTLTSLQNGVSQQTQTLNATMQQIGDRQRSLTVALDAQRDVVNGLLNRLALAQDETAATAERTVARLNDSTQQIAKQLGTIDSQAQSTLANVQATSSKFADEAGSLSLHAQQAEQQMRAVLSVTAGMQEQARNLRESMQGETARVIDQLTGIIAQLEGASSQLKQQSNAATSTMDQSALHLENLTRTSGEQLQRHAETLSNAASQAEARISGTEDRIRGHLRLVSDVTEQTDREGRQIAAMVETAVGGITALRESLTEAGDHSRTAIDQAGARIDEVRVALQAEVVRLMETSEAAALQVTTAAQTLATESTALRSNLSSSESALSSAADLVRAESLQMPATLDRSASAIEAAGERLRTQARDTDNALLGTADRFISVTGTARETMIDEMKQISRTAAEAEEVLSRFNKALAEQVESMRSSGTVLASGQKELVTKAGESLAQLAAASERLGQLRGDASQSAEKLARDFEALEARATSAGERLAHVGDTVDRNLATLTQTAERAEGQMLVATSSFRDQFERIRNGVQEQIDEINRGLMQITAQLERTGAALRSTTAGTVADVEKISSRFEQTSNQAATQLVDKTDRMRSTTEDVGRLLSGLGDQIDVLLNRLSVAGDGIKRHEGSIVTQLQTALGHLGSVAERLESSRSLAGNVSEHAVARLSEVAATVEQHIENLSNRSEISAGILTNASRIFGDQTGSLNRGVQEAHSQVVVMNKSIEDMQQRTDRLRVSLKLQGDELMNSLKQILDQLENTGDGIGDSLSQALRAQSAAAGINKVS